MDTEGVGEHSRSKRFLEGTVSIGVTTPLRALRACGRHRVWWTLGFWHRCLSLSSVFVLAHFQIPAHRRAAPMPLASVSWYSGPVPPAL